MANNDKVANKVCLIVIDGWGVSSEPHGEHRPGDFMSQTSVIQ